MNLIPLEREAECLRMFRDGEDVAVIHAFAFPGGNRAVSYPLLRSILESLSLSDEAAAPSDELPDDMADVLGDLTDLRKKLMDALDAGPSLDGEPNSDMTAAINVNKAVCENVKASLAVSKHRMELQRHRDWVSRSWRSGMRRG